MLASKHIKNDRFWMTDLICHLPVARCAMTNHRRDAARRIRAKERVARSNGYPLEGIQCQMRPVHQCLDVLVAKHFGRSCRPNDVFDNVVTAGTGVPDASGTSTLLGKKAVLPRKHCDLARQLLSLQACIIFRMMHRIPSALHCLRFHCYEPNLQKKRKSQNCPVNLSSSFHHEKGKTSKKHFNSG